MDVEVAAAVRPADDTEVTIYVPDAKLWSMDEPNLYTVVARLQKNNETYDEIHVNTGVRSYSVTPDGGFLLTTRLFHFVVYRVIRTGFIKEMR